HTSTYEGHDLLNLRGQYDVTDAFGLFGAVTNLGDTRFADRADIIVRGGNAVERFFPGEDRAVQIGASVRF
ncbi:MAG: hypothetical protein RLO21_11755, partial [Nitratireductor sp.]